MQWWSIAVKTVLVVVSLFLPAWRSLEAIESPHTQDDRQWLSYWLVYAVAVMVGKLLWPILQWVPLSLELTVLATAWLVLPHFKGALYTLELYVLPALISVRGYLQTVPMLQDFMDAGTPVHTAPKGRFSKDMGAERTQVAEVLDQVKHVLDAKLDKLERAKASGNLFEQKLAEKTFAKSITRLEKMVTKGKAEDRKSTPRSPVVTHGQAHGYVNAPKENGGTGAVLEYS